MIQQSNLAPGTRSTWRGRLARSGLERLAGGLEQGTLTVEFPGAERRVFRGKVPGLEASLRVLDERLYRKVLLAGEVGFGEAYVEGLFETDDLVSLLALGMINRRGMGLARLRVGWMGRAVQRWRHRRRSNTRPRARANIIAHYDLPPEFFRLFLDQGMTYSCALWKEPGETLEQAQRNKHRSLLTKGGIPPGSHILEVGSGWGEFALLAAREYATRVTTMTISPSQAEVVRVRVAAEELAGQVEVQLRDYRDINGRFDAVFSTEMLEAVGAEYYPAYFEACARVLAPGGRLVIQTITVPDAAFEAQRGGANWIQLYVFPGGVLPSLGAIEEAAAGAGFRIIDVEQIGHHYVRTLAEWRRRFHENIEPVRRLGFGQRFERTWDYYLAASQAAFQTATTGDAQVVLERMSP